MNKAATLVALFATAIFSAVAHAADVANNLPGVSGYDLVSYQTGKRPIRGNGHFVSVHEGVTYLFATAENKAEFDGNPKQYVPAYGGYCAYGVSVGKKFAGDPEVWRVVDGRLYLNLDATVQDLWLADVPGKIREADSQWQRIKDKSPASL